MIHSDSSMNTFVPIALFKHRRRRSSRMQIPKSVVLPFAKSKMIQVCNWKMTAIVISRSDSIFLRKRRENLKPSSLVGFTILTLVIFNSMRNALFALALFVSLYLFLLSITFSHTRSHHVFRCIVALFPSCIIRIWFYNNINSGYFINFSFELDHLTPLNIFSKKCWIFGFCK